MDGYITLAVLGPMVKMDMWLRVCDFTPCKKSFGYIEFSLSVPLSTHMPCKRNYSLTEELILLKLYTLAEYDLRMCMEEEDPGPKYFKEDVIN